ncbi:MAG: hypothetical protein ACQGVC_03360 [Myxococcota bacterium]
MSAPGAPHGQQDATDVDVEVNPWIFHGLFAGVAGAAIVAGFFLVVDVFESRAFRTPAALGSAVFLGQALEPGDAIEPALVAAYTVLHGAVFVSVGLLASFVLLGHRRDFGPGAGIALGALLFGALEGLLLGFFTGTASEVMPGLIPSLGFGRIAVANLLAASVMTAMLFAGATGSSPR